MEGKPFDTVIEERVLRPAAIEGIRPCHDLAASGFVAGFAPIARDYPATFLIQLPDDGSHDSFEFNWGEVRSYARRVQDPQ